MSENKFEKSRPPYFPMMIDIRNKKVLVIGGGKIASRRALTFLKCGAEVIAVSPEFCDEFPEGAKKIFREFQPSDLDGIFLVTSASNNREVNRLAGIEAKRRKIPVSVADCKEECNFFFPSLINSEERPYISVSVSSAGISSSITKKLSDKLRKVLDSWIQEITA